MKLGIACAVYCLAIAAPQLVLAADLPFKQYSARAYEGAEAPSLHFDNDSRKFKKRLEKAVQGPINFAGRYVFTSWADAGGCKSAAVIDVATGNTSMFPRSLCKGADGKAVFEYRRDSRLIVTSGKFGANGADETHFFTFEGTYFTPLPLPPEFNPEMANQRLPATDGLKSAFAYLLRVIILRPAFGAPDAEQQKALDQKQLLGIADVLITTSVRQSVTRDGVRYDLLYNWMADAFFLVRYDGGRVKSIGVMSGTEVSTNVYQVPDKENFVANILQQRPVLFGKVVKDLTKISEVEKSFGTYLVKEEESLLVRENILSAMKLLKAGNEEPCASAAQTYIKKIAPTFRGRSLPPGATIYTGIEFPSPDGRVLSFADERTNRFVGFVVFDVSDKTMCKPTAVLTSAFGQ